MDLFSAATFNKTNQDSTTLLSSQHSQGHTAITCLMFKILTYMSFYYEIIFFPFGLIFNLLLFLMFSISSMGTTKTTRVFYMAMAYGEFVTVLFKDTFYFWAGLGVPFLTRGLSLLGPLDANSHVNNDSTELVCGLYGILWFSHEMFANYTFVVFELHRVVAIYAPLQARYLFTKRGTLITV